MLWEWFDSIWEKSVNELNVATNFLCEKYFECKHQMSTQKREAYKTGTRHLYQK